MARKCVSATWYGGGVKFESGAGPPPMQIQSYSKTKNEARNETRRLKKEQLEVVEERRMQQLAAQRAGAQKLKDLVVKTERARSRDAKKGTKSEVKQPTKVKEEKLTVKKHSVNISDGSVTVMFQKGSQKAVWVGFDQIWEPHNITMYLPAWRAYCTKKNMPPDWGQGETVGVVADKEAIDLDGKEEQGDVLREEPDGEKQEARCCGHVLDDRGRVHMKLRWLDSGEESYGEVRKIMKSGWERKHLGKTWFEYCEANSLSDDLFRMEGISKVVGINGHEWRTDGRPVVEIRWKHGEVGKVLVKNVIEKTDDNGFKVAWKAYLDGIEEGSNEKLYKGNVDKDRRGK
jgi:hypothetical protein